MQSALALPGLPSPEHIHLTLAYIGPSSAYSSADLEKLHHALDAFVATQPILEGSITDFGQFAPTTFSRQHFVIWRKVALDGLSIFRTALVAQLTQAGFPPSTDFPFVPHLTLAYIESEPVLPPHLPHLPWTATQLTLFVGSSQILLPLQASPPEPSLP